jgi:Ca-activated chloride channel family protein
MFRPVLLMLFLVFRSTGAAAQDIRPLSDVRIDVAVSGPLAEIALTQTFENVTDHTVAAAYLFPLERDAVVDAMSMRLDDRTIEGRIEPVETAREQYEAAIAAGQTAALTETLRWNLFRQTVGNIPPRGRIEVTLRIIQPIPRVDGRYELTLPLVDGARFVPPNTAADQALATPQTFPADLRAQVDLQVQAGMPIEDFAILEHPAFISPGPGGEGIDAHAANVPLTGDFVARWRTASDEPQIGALHDDRHLMLVFEPPRDAPYDTRTPRDIVVILHRSRSIGRNEWGATARILQQGIRGLTAADRLRLVRAMPSGSAPQVFDAGPLDASTAIPWVGQSVNATPPMAPDVDLQAALERAWTLPEVPGTRRSVVLVSDGLSAENEAALTWLATQPSDGPRPPLHTLATGTAVDRFALEALADEGGGVFVNGGTRALTREGFSAVAGAFEAVLDRPVLSDIRVDWGDWGARHVSPDPIPDLVLGRATRVLVRNAYRDGGPLVVTGRIAGEPVEMRVQPTAIRRGRAIASTWARERIDALGRRQLREGIPAEEEGLPLALEYAILSPWTAFIAIDPRVRTVVAEPPPSEAPVSVAADGKMHAVDTREVLTKEFLERIPTGRTYQTSVQTAAGVGNGDDEPARAAEESAYALEGVNVSDPVIGTYSRRYDDADSTLSIEGRPKMAPPSLGRFVDGPPSPVLVPPLPGRLTSAIAPRLQAPPIDAPVLRADAMLGAVGDAPQLWGRGAIAAISTPRALYGTSAGLGASWTGRDVLGGRWVDVPLATRFAAQPGPTRLDLSLDARHQQLSGRTFDLVDAARTAGSGAVHVTGPHGSGGLAFAMHRLGCADDSASGSTCSLESPDDGSSEQPTRTVAALDAEAAVTRHPTALRVGLAAQATRFAGLASPVAQAPPPTLTTQRLGGLVRHAFESRRFLRTGAMARIDGLSRRPTSLDDPAESPSARTVLPSGSGYVGLRVAPAVNVDLGAGRHLDLSAPELALPERVDGWLRMLVEADRARLELKVGWDRRRGPLSLPIERLHTAPSSRDRWQRDAVLTTLGLRADLPDDGFVAFDIRVQGVLSPADAAFLIDPAAPWTPGLLLAHRPFFAGLSTKARVLNGLFSTDVVFKAAVASPLAGEPPVQRWWTGWQGLAELGVVERFPMLRDDSAFTVGVHGTWRRGRPGPVDLSHVDGWIEPDRLGTLGVFGRIGLDW